MTYRLSPYSQVNRWSQQAACFEANKPLGGRVKYYFRAASSIFANADTQTTLSRIAPGEFYMRLGQYNECPKTYA